MITPKIKQMLESSDEDMVCLGAVTLFNLPGIEKYFGKYLDFYNLKLNDKVMILQDNRCLFFGHNGIWLGTRSFAMIHFPYSYRNHKKIEL